MAWLRIPPLHIGALTKFCVADDDLVDNMVDALNKAPVSLSGAELADFVSSQLDNKSTSVTEAIELLLSLTALRLRLDLDPSQLIDLVAEAMESSDNPELQALAKSKDSLARHLRALLGVESLVYPTKAADIIMAHEYVFSHARIITDIRPIFGSLVTNEPKAAAIVHTLQITCDHADDVKDFYIALGADDLNLLRKTLDRAEAKARSLRSVLKRSGITATEG